MVGYTDDLSVHEVGKLPDIGKREGGRMTQYRWMKKVGVQSVM